jgi:diguanylate cyclase (GGDEF)-like protein
LSLLLVDVDRLKAINDEHGHGCSDERLRHVADTLRACARRSGHLTARVGGDEFAIVLIDTDGEGALGVANELCSSLARTRVPGPAAWSSGLTIGASIGVATVEASDTTRDPSALCRAADDALYGAKDEGRGRACIARPAAANPPSGVKLAVISGDK